MDWKDQVKRAGENVNISIGLLAVLLALPAAAQQAPPDLETVSLTENIYAIIGAGGNVGVSVGDDGVFVIDDKLKPVTPALVEALEGITDQNVRFVFNTHWHADHVGGNEYFGKAGAVIVAQDNVRERMSSDQFMESMDRRVPASPDAALPIITFTDSLTFHLNGDTLHVTHMPHAHTDGDSLVYFEKANVLHMGDAYFSSGYPFIDLGSGGSIEGVIAAVEAGLEIADAETKVIPGHGPLGTEETLRQYHDMLTGITQQVRHMMTAGQSLEAIQEAGVTKEFDDRWGGGFIDSESFVETIYTSLRSAHST